ncbi:isopentenyl-diphosphate Delta-isomerase [Fulvivirga lutimaris]|uniref:isopentenyl-diphosphate Delta-isomerase n=1 Tax=Fulvivirga lutimaris TaxID=1819566 RepID=UPI0012BCF3E0|nr:isopentenyl-diphosphate Delta-isomerase [Fulvivirga lutimaris]MTI38678.1 isopentenyl-diphosphate Delta-isomerase [Fulvivirga lutimaris]
MSEVILVNSKDEELGILDKMEAHFEGVLHRAFSVLVYNSKGEMLIQKRAADKYHSGGLWTNACCSHQHPGESSEVAAKRRLKEEIGLEANPEFLYKFIYKAELDNNLTEFEYDHVLTCITDDKPVLNPAEVEDFQYVDIKSLMLDIQQNPTNYTFWFKQIMENLQSKMTLEVES